MLKVEKYFDQENSCYSGRYKYDYPDILELIKIFTEVKKIVAFKAATGEMNHYLSRIQSLVSNNFHIKNTKNFRQKIVKAKEINILDLYPFLKIIEKGQRRWVNCCFHDGDRNPSMIVDDANRFHCFGCGFGGSSIDFIMKLKGLNFVGAVNALVGGDS